MQWGEKLYRQSVSFLMLILGNFIENKLNRNDFGNIISDANAFKKSLPKFEAF